MLLLKIERGVDDSLSVRKEAVDVFSRLTHFLNRVIGMYVRIYPNRFYGNQICPAIEKKKYSEN